MLGRYLAERLIDERAIEDDSVVDVFLHTEQICAYVRHIQHGVEGDIRGIDRVKAKVQQTKRRIPIDVGAKGQILGNQKIYGLWGLFSSPARVSGLIQDGPIGTTPDAQEFVEKNYAPQLEHVFRPLRDLVCNGGHLNGANPDPVFKAFGNILDKKFTDAEKSFYSEYLRDAVHVLAHPSIQQQSSKNQQLLVQLLIDNDLLSGSLGRDEFLLLRRLSRTPDENLHTGLDQIVRAEAVFAVAMVIFEYVLSRDGHLIADIDQMLSNRWGNDIPNIDAQANSDLLHKIDEAYRVSDVAGHFDRCQKALQDGLFGDVVETLISWNKLIQLRRGGAPWVQLGKQGRLEVRYRGYEKILPSADELTQLWRYSYFLPSLQSITRQLTSTAA